MSFEHLSLVFSAAMAYWPNVGGMLWFVKEVLPLIWQQVPVLELAIVGSNPAEEIRELEEDPKIRVKGFVDYVRECRAGAEVCIAPLRIARGIQNKVLKAPW